MNLHKNISTGLGTAIILIFAITAAVFSFRIYDYQMAQWEREAPDYAIMKTAKKTQSSRDTQLANPASVFCGEHGGKLEIRTGQDGGQTGFCTFNDGKECEEWAYFRGECSISGASMKDWDTYSDKKFGFEIKYPADWRKPVASLPPTPREGVLYEKEIYFSKDGSGNEINIGGANAVVIDVCVKNTCNDYDYAEQNAGLPIKPGVDRIEGCPSHVKKVLVGGHEAKIIYVAPQDACFEPAFFYYLREGNHDYFIYPTTMGYGSVAYDGLSESQRKLPEFADMINTFKFTK